MQETEAKMTSQSPNQVLNRLVINLGRSLLQYLAEASPWTPDEDDASLVKVNELIAAQQQVVDQIVELLTDRHHLVEFGTYPTDYTDLQFLSLDFLLVQTLRNARSDAEMIAALRVSLTEDAEASELADLAAKTQAEIVTGLQSLVEKSGDHAA